MCSRKKNHLFYWHWKELEDCVQLGKKTLLLNYIWPYVNHPSHRFSVRHPSLAKRKKGKLFTFQAKLMLQIKRSDLRPPQAQEGAASSGSHSPSAGHRSLPPPPLRAQTDLFSATALCASALACPCRKRCSPRCLGTACSAPLSFAPAAPARHFVLVTSAPEANRDFGQNCPEP